ncbi:MAG: fructosamine kinase family protein [Pseudarcicella sp.]|nr:fructosamine kinase family protein [Pseudarcicella sp.]MBP6410282.1 fructosamine kinase family protein [Pseudarcicella sp.]
MTLQSQEQYQFIESILLENFGYNPQVQDFEFFYGGNFNLAVKVKVTEGVYFIKWNNGDHHGMFEAEAKCLQLLQNTHTIAVPKVVNYGKILDKEYLMIEFMSSSFNKDNYWEDFGHKLALLHQNTNTQFGLDFDNYIGVQKQTNDWMENGVDFFIQKRLKAQIDIANYDRKISKPLNDKFENLFQKLHNIIPNDKPSLLHGDLWSGNVMTNPQGEAALIDAACYYGLREAELAFTTMFGGFETSFYEAYNSTYPIPKGFSERIPIYNLYPLLVHVNLFGGGYLDAVEKIVSKY